VALKKNLKRNAYGVLVTKWGTCFCLLWEGGKWKKHLACSVYFFYFKLSNNFVFFGTEIEKRKWLLITHGL